MKKHTFLTCMLLLLNVGLFAQSSVWKVEKNNTFIYIGGTVHILRAQDYPLPQEFDSAFSKSDVLVLEADISKMQDSTAKAEMMKKLSYELGDNLENHLSEDVYVKLRTESESKGIPIQALSQFKPSMVSITFTVLKMQQMGISAEGVDQYYYSKAKQEEKSFLFFETVEEQIDMIAKMGEGNEDDFILKTLEDIKDIESEFTDLIEDWKKGEDKIMQKQISKMNEDFPDVYKSLLVDRNKKWIPTIEGFFENDKIEFVLVGALHLHGKDGILNQLNKKGYTISQITY